ncbi:unnamed protein product [Amoebophrya sp. A25]|nr:unnamed protein product [Amoebophrya sp. A25]|eukprot:GSA25T00002368001.1
MTSFDMRAVIDWAYYKERLGSSIQKIICIPAVMQRFPNPVPRIPVPEWLAKREKQWNQQGKQSSILDWCMPETAAEVAAPLKRARSGDDMEDCVGRFGAKSDLYHTSSGPVKVARRYVPKPRDADGNDFFGDYAEAPEAILAQKQAEYAESLMKQNMGIIDAPKVCEEPKRIPYSDTVYWNEQRLNASQWRIVCVESAEDREGNETREGDEVWCLRNVGPLEAGQEEPSWESERAVVVSFYRNYTVGGSSASAAPQQPAAGISLFGGVATMGAPAEVAEAASQLDSSKPKQQEPLVEQRVTVRFVNDGTQQTVPYSWLAGGANSGLLTVWCVSDIREHGLFKCQVEMKRPVRFGVPNADYAKEVSKENLKPLRFANAQVGNTVRPLDIVRDGNKEGRIREVVAERPLDYDALFPEMNGVFRPFVKVKWSHFVENTLLVKTEDVLFVDENAPDFLPVHLASNAKPVKMRPPRNQAFKCDKTGESLVLQTMVPETEFQTKKSEDALNEMLSREQVESEKVYEAEEPLDFKFISQVGSRINVPCDRLTDAQRRYLRFKVTDLSVLPPNDGEEIALDNGIAGNLARLRSEETIAYSSSRHAFLFVSVEKGKDGNPKQSAEDDDAPVSTKKMQRAVFGCYAPSCNHASMVICGPAPTEEETTDELRDELYNKILETHMKYLAHDGVCHEALLETMEAVVVFVSDWEELSSEATSVLEQLREVTGEMIYVLSSNVDLKELRGLGVVASNVAVLPLRKKEKKAGRSIKQIPCLRKAPIAFSALKKDDSVFPPVTEDMGAWAIKRFSRSVKKRHLWWLSQLSFARFANLPVCNLSQSSTPGLDSASTKRFTWDVLYNRCLKKKELLTWASRRPYPDVGNYALSNDDIAEFNANTLKRLLPLSAAAAEEQRDARAASMRLTGLDEIEEENHPGFYRSVCLTVKLHNVLISCGVANAVEIADEFNSEISLYRKQRQEQKQEILEHTEECGIPAMEALVATARQLIWKAEVQQTSARTVRGDLLGTKKSFIEIIKEFMMKNKFEEDNFLRYQEYLRTKPARIKKEKERKRAAAAAGASSGSKPRLLPREDEPEGVKQGGNYQVGGSSSSTSKRRRDDDDAMEIVDEDGQPVSSQVVCDRDGNDMIVDDEEPGGGGDDAVDENGNPTGRLMRPRDHDEVDEDAAAVFLDPDLLAEMEAYDKEFDITESNLSEIVAKLLEEPEVVADLPVASLQSMLRLANLERDGESVSSLMEYLYSWLCSPRSYLYDPALLKRVNAYAQKGFELFLRELRLNKCEVVYANGTKIVIATGRLSFQEAMVTFEQVRQGVIQDPLLRMLECSLVPECVSEAFFGLMWYDPNNFLGFAIPIGSDEIQDRERGQPLLESAEFHLLAGQQLPEFVRGSLFLFLHQYIECAMQMAHDRKSQQVTRGVGNNLTSDALDEEMVERLGKFLDATLSRHVLKFLKDLPHSRSVDLQRERHAEGQIYELERGLDLGKNDSDDSDDEARGIARGQELLEIQEKQKVLEELQRKWNFSDVPPPARQWRAVGLEWAQTLVTFLKLEPKLSESCDKLFQTALLQVLKIDEPHIMREVWRPNYMSIKIPHCECPRCSVVYDVDVVTNPFDKSGGETVWTCLACVDGEFPRSVMELRLVDLVHKTIQAYQSQSIICNNCRKLKDDHMYEYCPYCSSKLSSPAAVDDVRRIFHSIEIIAHKHALQNLLGTIQFYRPFL